MFTDTGSSPGPWNTLGDRGVLFGAAAGRIRLPYGAHRVHRQPGEAVRVPLAVEDLGGARFGDVYAVLIHRVG